MVLARLVTGRYGTTVSEDQPRSTAQGPGWLKRVLAAIFTRKH